jgi:hypothetical protein
MPSWLSIQIIIIKTCQTNTIYELYPNIHKFDDSLPEQFIYWFLKDLSFYEYKTQFWWLFFKWTLICDRLGYLCEVGSDESVWYVWEVFVESWVVWGLTSDQMVRMYQVTLSIIKINYIKNNSIQNNQSNKLHNNSHSLFYPTIMN